MEEEEEDLSIQRQRAPLAHLRGVPSLACIQQSHGGGWSHALNVVVIQLHHGGISTRTQAFDLAESEEAVSGGLPFLHDKTIP